MKVAIIGSRSIYDYQHLIDAIRESGFEITEVVSGGANGVDTLASNWACQHDIPSKIFKPDYTAHGKSAPHVRNSQIVDYCDAVIAVWDGESKGTESVINKASKAFKKIYVHNTLKEIEPRGWQIVCDRCGTHQFFGESIEGTQEAFDSSYHNAECHRCFWEELSVQPYY